MSIQSMVTRVCLIALFIGSLVPSSAQAGPLLDWLFGGFARRQAPAYPVGPASPVGGAQTLGAYYGASMPVVGNYGYGYVAQSPVGIAAATLPQPTVSYVPDYRTSYNRAPVTYYRPIMTTDPQSGAQVVTLAPCTSYEYQTQRVPTWGSQALLNTYGVNPALTRPEAPAIPTYTIPSGGIPLAASMPSSSYAAGYPNFPQSYQAYGNYQAYGTYPSTIAPYAAGFGNYSALQVPGSAMPGAIQTVPGTNALVQPPVASYPTSPYGIPGGYYGTTGGGSCGIVAAPSVVPGLAAPYPNTFAAPPAAFQSPAPQNIYPHAQPGTGVAPGSLPVGPLPGSSFNNPPDPNAQPTLPPVPGQSSARLDPRNPVQNVVRQPISGREHSFDQFPRNENKSSNSPLMKPIPVPEKFKNEPRWNPGLLREDDQTAQNSIPSDAAVAMQDQLWGSKPIKWARFTSPISSNTESHVQPASNLEPVGMRPIDRNQIVRQKQAQPAILPPNDAVHQMPTKPNEPVMVPLDTSSQDQTRPILELGPASANPWNNVNQRPAPAAPSTSKSRYKTNGWQSAR